jgi:hypothetical protein
MTYLFEQLGAERFQHLCQALLVKDYPDLQCFPVGQPDGGRDALSRGDGTTPATVVQVKFKRRDDGEENADWMIDALKGELPKILRLVDNGAKRYIMVTNARGTAHEDTGRIDLVQAWLTENVPIEAVCFWRDEVERRVDGTAEVKLSYPAMLTGEHALTLIVHAQMGAQKQRLSRIIRAFLAEQFRKDEQVKFRQVELANSLLGLFVDVPLDVSELVWNTHGRSFNQKARGAIRALAQLNQEEQSVLDTEVGYGTSISYTAGTADVLLDGDMQAAMPWVVLRGAPGQGKSTLAQYVCQVHRARYLDKNDFLDQLPDNHAGAPFRLPFKVDLRDFAGYLDGRSYLGQESTDPDAHRTLEGFLANLVSIQSGGLQFSRDDLAETLAGVPVLLFLDGLDEVADLQLRRKVVDRVVEGLTRLKETQADIQVVVTSRPSLLGEAPSFSRSFTKLDLAPIGSTTVFAYADKWVVARHLDEERAHEVIDILRQKLALGHIRDLTRNPMQLTILLSLIHSIGYSLPDVRTDLYRQYVDLFMTREAEKSPMVREYRPLLMEIVEFLAWTLQCSAESDRSAGSVTRDDLRSLVADRLAKSNQRLEILDDLFTGGLERVYVLVQRVEGLYEFEVQPLREYFAAKFLYSSAPISNFRHQTVHGDRAQRFEAIAANPYWANVTRFYAGFYEGGEVGSLSTSLRELAGSRTVGLAISARSVGSALLADWIFRSKRFVQDEVIELVFDEVGVNLASNSKLAGFENVSLPSECGRETLARRLFDNHIAPKDAEPSRSLCALVHRNGGELLGPDFVRWVGEVVGSERSKRLRVALTSGGMAQVPVTEVEELLFVDSPASSEMNLRMRSVMSNEPALCSKSAQVAENAVQSLLDWGGFAPLIPSNNVTRLAWFLTPELYRGPDVPLSDEDFDDVGVDLASGRTLGKTVGALAVAYKELLDRDSWEEGDPWLTTVEALRGEFGEAWGIYRLCVINSGFGAMTDKAPAYDPTLPLFTQARVARSWRGKTSWWKPFLKTEDGNARLFWAAMLLAWAPSKYVTANLAEVSEIVEGLSAADLDRLLEVLELAGEVRRYRGGRTRGSIPVGSDVSVRLVRALVAAFGDTQLSNIPTAAKSDPDLAQVLEREALTKKLRRFEGWKGLSSRRINEWLALFAQAHRERVPLPGEVRHQLTTGLLRVNDAVLTKALYSAKEYPREISNVASMALRSMYEPKTVREIAESENWTFE